MDRKGIAIVTACVLFMIVWVFYLAPKYSPVPSPVPPQIPDRETAVAPFKQMQEPVEVPQRIAMAVPESSQPPEEVMLQNSVCEFSFTSMGGALTRVRLKHFFDDRNEKFTLVEPFNDGIMPLGLEILEPAIDLRKYNHTIIREGHDRVRFLLDLPNGLQIEKYIQLTPNKYDFTFKIKFSNISYEPMEFIAKLHGPGSIVREDDVQNQLMGAVSYLKNRKEDSASPKPNKPWQIPKNIPVGKEEASTTDISLVYIGICNRFFGTVLLAEEPFLVRGLGTKPIDGTLRLQKIAADPASPTRKEKELAANMSSYIVMAPIRLNAGESREFTFTFYAGPKHADELAQYGPLSKLLDYGMFRSISKLLLAILRFFYKITNNYGISIILMTILVKMVLFPLSRKGAISQAKQQKLAPQMKELQAKYKNNKQKLQQETMKMYKEEGVHPLGGCLPMLLQLPVFIGLMRLLQYSIEIRQAVFIPGWIDDLSRPDTIGYFPAALPFLGGLRINILPLIMGAVSILHQKMMPKPADPQAQQQQMMFKFMPIMFVFLLYNWPSGLLLYWTMSSGLSVLEQYLLRKSIGKT